MIYLRELTNLTHMAQGMTISVSNWTENNKTAKSTTKVVEKVVFENQLVPDIRDVNPGVINGLKFYGNSTI